jgi:WD40 repeat protein
VVLGYDQQWQPVVRTINLPDWGLSVAYSSNGSVLAVGGDEFSQLFDSATGERRAELEANCGYVFSVSFSCNDCTLATASGHSIRLWDVNTGSFITELQIDVGKACSGAAFHPRIDHILAASVGACIWVWDINKTSQPTSFEVEGSTGNFCWLRTSEPQQPVLVGCENGNIEMWGVELSQQIKIFSPPPSGETEKRVWAVASSYNGSLVASGSSDGRVVVYNTNLGHSVHCFQLHTHVLSVAFSPTQQMLACRLVSGAVRIIRFDNNPVVLLGAHRDRVRSVVFSPDGQFLASASEGETLNVWETSAADSVALNEHQLQEIRFIRFLHDGNFLLTRSDDDMTKIWDTGTGALSATFAEKTRDAVVLSDGMHIVSLSHNETLTLWDRRQEKPLCTNTTLEEYICFGLSLYSHHTRILGFISTHCSENDVEVYCWAVEPMRTDGPQMVPIAHGTIHFGFYYTIPAQITHTGSIEEDNFRLIVKLEDGQSFSASWNDPAVFSEQLQELQFVKDSEQSLVEDVPSSLATKQVSGRASEDGAWILNEHGERVLWLSQRNRIGRWGSHCIVWYGLKLAVGGESGRVTLVDFSNINENDG